MCEQCSYKCGCMTKLTRCVRRGRCLARLIKPASVSFVLRAIKLSRPKEKVQFNNLFSIEDFNWGLRGQFRLLRKAEIFVRNLNLFELLFGRYFWVKKNLPGFFSAMRTNPTSVMLVHLRHRKNKFGKKKNISKRAYQRINCSSLNLYQKL